MNNTILPADTYIVVNKTIVNESDRKLVTMLYQPIIGHTAVSMYFTLVDDLVKQEIMSEELTHHHLMSTMQLKLSDIVIAREKLEAVGLLKTYIKKSHVNTYVYVLYSPMTASEFLNHPVLNIVLYNNIGKKEYEKIVTCYKLPKISLKEYVKVLTSREKEIIEARYGLNGKEETTQKDIAKKLNISRSYVSRLEKRATTKILREFIKNEQNIHK